MREKQTQCKIYWLNLYTVHAYNSPKLIYQTEAQELWTSFARTL